MSDNEHVDIIHAYCGGFEHLGNLSKKAIEEMEDYLLQTHHL